MVDAPRTGTMPKFSPVRIRQSLLVSCAALVATNTAMDTAGAMSDGAVSWWNIADVASCSVLVAMLLLSAVLERPESPRGGHRPNPTDTPKCPPRGSKGVPPKT